MTNNDILRRVRYTFDFSDAEMISLFALENCEVNRAQVSNWLKKNDHPEHEVLDDSYLAVFLNGLTTQRRSKKDGPQIPPEKKLNNNIILRKFKIALDLKAEELIVILDLADFKVSKPELSAFFRKPGHKQYRPCHDQILRNFLHGIKLKYRPEPSSEPAK